MVKFYLVLTLLGILLPYGAFVPWLVSNGLDIGLLFSEAVATPISIFAWLDVLVAAIALLGFMDGQRHKVKYRYFAVLGTLSVGVSFGLPLYLYLKEKQSLQPQP
ncbi:DUF2834 domain-containing protein [Vibrio parahaemolyticus]|nr:DUF2834 domain-containing protein [Vibrio parahaemolyticus]